MHSMYQRKAKIPCLYVKSAPQTYMIAQIFSLARSEAPCLLIFEDIDTIVTSATRSYFFNEVRKQEIASRCFGY
jgi:ATP-dependent 26S proteasome regulatory subunit